MTFVEELHLRKALTELGLLVVLTMKLLYIKRRTIETIEVLLIEDEIDCSVSEQAYSCQVDSPLHLGYLYRLDKRLLLSIVETYEGLSLLSACSRWTRRATDQHDGAPFCTGKDIGRL